MGPSSPIRHHLDELSGLGSECMLLFGSWNAGLDRRSYGILSVVLQPTTFL